MATPPTFVAEYESVWGDSTTPKTASTTVAAGDVLAVIGGVENSDGTLGTPTGGSLTYTLQQSVSVADYCEGYVWTALPASSQTYSLSIARSGLAVWWGFNALRFSGSDGVGTSTKTNVTSGAPSLAITTTADNSAIVVIALDWNAADGASRTWRTVNGFTPTTGNGLEVSYFRDAAHYTLYAAYYPDAGTAGAKTVGLSAPSGQKYSIIAVEIKGTAGGGATVAPDGISVPVALGSPTLADSSLAASPDGVSVPVALGAPTLADGSMTVTPAGVPVPVVLGDPTLTWSGAIAPDGITIQVVLGDPTVGASSAAPDGISIPVALGSPTVAWSGSIAPDGIAVPVSLGTPIVGAVAVAPDGITVPVVLGDPALSWSGTAAPDGIGVPVSLGAPTLTLSGIAPDGINIPVVLGSPTLSWSSTISPDGISVPVALGAPSVVIPGAIIHRPNTGTTSRPTTGTVTRPNTGIIRRP